MQLETLQTSVISCVDRDDYFQFSRHMLAAEQVGDLYCIGDLWFRYIGDNNWIMSGVESSISSFIEMIQENGGVIHGECESCIRDSAFYHVVGESDYFNKRFGNN